ncbi:dynamin family protein [Dactylosporangium sp. NPDC049140]|uniref:dynamin family protein n=1 Tax=Dactylosporangium sp. NPDC049140 TaxID=3155647 RepID=UPI0033E02346
MDIWEAGLEAQSRPASPRAPQPRWLDLLERTTRICADHERPDLVRRLGRRRARLLDPQLRVMVVGEAGRGKSRLINALLGAEVCPVGDDPPQSVTMVVQHASAPGAHLIHGRASRFEDEPREDRRPVPVEGLAERLGGAAGGDVLYAEIGLPRALLAGGLALIEATGVDWSDPAPAVAGIAALTRADTVLFVTEATRELSATELGVLADLGRTYPGLAVALTKTDLTPDWRGVLERNRRLLQNAGVPAVLLGLSAALRLHAVATGDQALNAESGFGHLVAYLRELASGKSERLAPAASGLAARTALEDLAVALRAEQSAPRPNPPDAMSRVHAAQRALEELRRCTARWQYTLADEVADLVSEIEYDLRDRTRTVLRRAEESLDAEDPARNWRSFAEWLDGSLRDTAEANLGQLAERLAGLAERVAAEFPPGAGAYPPQWTSPRLRDAPGRLGHLDRPALDRLSIGQKVFTGLRGSYGGVLMFGLATGLAGMPLINPVSLGAGALFAGKSIRDESRSARTRRQATVKLAVQRHVDDIFTRLNKDAKDTIRQAQRALRGHFTELSEQRQQEIVESARHAQRAVDDDAAVREHRARHIQRELAQLAGLYRQATALSAGRPAPIPAQRGPSA